MGNTISKKCSAVLIVGSLVFQGCIAYGNKDKVSLSTETKNPTSPLNASLSSFDVSNNIVSIHGAGFANVTGLKIKRNGVDTTLSINIKSDTQIIAVATNALSLLVGSTFELILSSASAQSSFPITFTLDAMNAQPGQVLKFDGTKWGPESLASSQTYLGTWDADAQSPTLPSNPNAGDYYIVTVAGDYPNIGDTYNIGDWIIYSGSVWEKVVSGLGTKLSITGGTLTGDLKLDSLLRIKGASNYVTLKGSASLASDITLTLPITVGTSGQVLTTNGSGVLSWTTPATSLTPTGAAGGDLSGTYPDPTITALNATKIANGSVSNTKFQYLSGVTSDIQTQLDSKQSGGSFLTALSGDVTTAAGPGSVAATVAQVGGVSAANIVAGVNLANASTNANTVSTTVKRDASGNFSAGTITATLNGTATNVTGVVAVANGGTGATTFSTNQLLFGNGASAIGGLTITGTPSILLSTNITGAPAWTTSTTGNYLKATTGTGVSFGAIVAADLPAAIAATKIADGSVSNAKFQYLSAVTSDIQAQLDSKQSSGSFLSALTGDVTASGPGSAASTVAHVGGEDASDIASGSILANAATNANTVSAIVKRDASGNFSAGTITATLNGTATGLSATLGVASGGTGKTTLTANELLFGNGAAAVSSVSVTGTPGVLLSTTVTGVPVWSTSTTGNYLKATTGVGVSFGAIAASDLPTSISAAKIADGSVNDTKFQYLSGVTSDIQTQLNAKQSSGSFLTALTGDVTASGPGSVASTVASVGGATAANVASATTLANAATNANTASTIVKRDASGNFTAGTITATLSGTATNVSGTVAVANGGSGRTTLTANEILLGNGTTGILSVGGTATPSVLLSTNVTGVPVWSTSTTGNFLKATTGSGVSFGTISSSDLPSGTLTGSGTAGKVPYYSAASTLADSPMTISGTAVGIAAASAIPLVVESTSGAISAIEMKNTGSSGGAEAIMSSNNTILMQTGGTNRVYIGSTFGVGSAAPTGVPFLVSNSTLVARFENTSVASSALSNNVAGVELVTKDMSTTGKYGVGIKFMSADTEFTTEPYKFLAGIYPRATEFYNADTKGGMAIDFLVSPNTPGASNVPVTAMTIDQNGSVGIGNSAPNSKLDVTGSITAVGLTANTVSAGQAYIGGLSVSSGAAASFNAVVQNTSATGYSATAYNDTTNTTQGVVGYANTSAGLFPDTFFMTSLGGKPMVFGILTSEVARISSAGLFGIGTNNPTQKLHVVGNILASGTVTGSSDRRLKKDIKPITDALKKLDSIVGVRYFWIDPEQHNNGEQIGVIAQDVEKVFPQAVITGSDGYKSVSYMGLVGPVIQAIKELHTKFKALVTQVMGIDSRVEKLELENAELKMRLARIEKALAK